MSLGHVQNQSYISTDLGVRVHNLRMVMSLVMLQCGHYDYDCHYEYDGAVFRTALDTCIQMSTSLVTPNISQMSEIKGKIKRYIF